jgi:hypothetical protein
MQVNGALAPMIKTLLFGPGEFLLSRLAIPLSPVAPVMLAAALAGSALVLRKTADSPAIGTALLLILIAAISGVVLRGNQADVNQIIFYLPMFVLGFGLLIAIFTKTLGVGERRGLLIVFVFSAAALMELFPRFAREQSIAAMPLVMLVLFYLLYLLRPAIRSLAGGELRYSLAIAVLPLTFSLIEGRLFLTHTSTALFSLRPVPRSALSAVAASISLRRPPPSSTTPSVIYNRAFRLAVMPLRNPMREHHYFPFESEERLERPVLDRRRRDARRTHRDARPN